MKSYYFYTTRLYLLDFLLQHILQQQFPQFPPLVHADIHELKRHILCAVIPHQRRSLQIPQAQLHFQRHLRSRRQVHTRRR